VPPSDRLISIRWNGSKNYTMVKSKRLSWIALKNQKILAVKVQYSHFLVNLMTLGLLR
jgi:hypothetical protein